jgi:FtsP/CotA-like multicopper oxidase with cupredoxin domain
MATKLGLLTKASFGLLLAAAISGLCCSEVANAQGGPGGGMGGGVIDPPPGAAFRDPVTATNESQAPGIVEVSLDLRRTLVDLNGTPANLMLYNGSLPGPTIRVRRGDVLRVHLRNSLPFTTERNLLGFERNHTNLHTHGWHVSPREPADAAHLDIPAGGSYDYEYDLQNLDPGALSFYHTHKHGLVAEQHWAGAAGVLVAEDDNDLLAPYETHIMMLKDFAMSGSEPTAYTMMSDYMHGKEGDIVAVNGQVNPILAARPGQVQRWRIVNASNARFYKLSLEGHSLNLIGTDGGPIDRPYPLSSILLSPGERLDLLVKASNATGSYKLLSLPYSRRGNMSSAQITLLTLACAGDPIDQTLPSLIDPEAMRMDMDTTMLPRRTLRLSMAMGRGYINGLDFDVAPYTIMSNVDMPEVWEIVNDSDMDHPFHQHVNEAQVLAITGGDADYARTYTTLPAWKDVVIVPRRGRVTLLVPVQHYTGMTMFHCHILEHEDIGMMGMWHLMDPMEPPVSVGEEGGRFERPTLLPPVPNPASGGMTLRFALSAATHVDLRIYDLQGKQVAVLASAPFSAGAHEVSWAGRDARGAALGAGVYFARMRANGVVRMQRLLRIR